MNPTADPGHRDTAGGGNPHRPDRFRPPGRWRRLPVPVYCALVGALGTAAATPAAYAVSGTGGIVAWLAILVLVALAGGLAYDPTPRRTRGHGAVQPPVPGGETPELLTGAERQAIDMPGKVYTLIAEDIAARGPTRDGDLAEIRTHIHAVQDGIGAQAAARAYPEEFRLLGGVIQR